MPVKKQNVVSLLDMKARFESMERSIDRVDAGTRFPPSPKPDGDTFPDLPLEGLVADEDIEILLLQYQAWIEYYEGIQEREEAVFELVKHKLEVLEGVLFNDYLERKVGTSTELQRTKMLKATTPYLSVYDTYTELGHSMRKLRRVLRTLSERSKKLSRIIEIRKRRGGPDG